MAGTPPPGATIETSTATPTAATLVVTGNLGTQNSLSLAGSDFVSSTGSTPFAFADGTDNAGFTSNPNGESVHTTYTAYDSLGNPVNVDVTAVVAIQIQHRQYLLGVLRGPPPTIRAAPARFWATVARLPSARPAGSSR